MIFRQVAADENFDLFKFESMGGAWHLGARRMLFGVRICGNPAAQLGFYSFDYCAGPQAADIVRLLRVMRRILSALPESVTDREVCDMLPGFEIKPVLRDLGCMAALYALASELEARGNVG